MPEEILSAETPEVAEPVTDGESAETQEVAEPVETQGKTDADSAFAQMRRNMREAQERAEEAERRLAEMDAREEAIRNLSGRDNAVESALAESLGLDYDEVVSQLDASTESARKDMEIEELRATIDNLEVDRRMESDLRTIQAIDPNVKSLEELGDVYASLIEAGATAEAAYYAAKAKDINTRATPPKPMGKIDGTPPSKDYYTEAEVDAMSPAEQSAKWEIIKKSMTKW